MLQSLYFLNLIFQAFSHLLWLYSLVCVGPGLKLRDRFSGFAAHIYLTLQIDCDGVLQPFKTFQGLKPLVTNGLSHPYHLDESTFIYRGSRGDFSFFISFFDEIPVNKQNSPRCDAAFCGVTSGDYSVCQCSIKRTPGLYGFKLTSIWCSNQQLLFNVFCIKSL